MPDSEAGHAFEGNLARVTDEQWLHAHAALADTGVLPEGELDFVLDPHLDGQSLVGADEIEQAPTDG